jgi:hypothetical protein
MVAFKMKSATARQLMGTADSRGHSMASNALVFDLIVEVTNRTQASARSEPPRAVCRR